MPGFEAFELLRPTDGKDTFLVYTRWTSTEDYENWLNGPAFQQGHRAHNTQGPVSTASDLWSFDVVQEERAEAPGPMTPSASVLEQLTGPGGQYEIVVEDVARRIRCRCTPGACARCGSWWPRARAAPRCRGSCRRSSATRSVSTTVSARVMAGALAGLGVQRGDRVALVSANVPEWVVTFWACAILGATLVPLNAWWKAEELEFGITDSEASVLIADTRRLATVRDRLPALSSLRHVFVIGDTAGDDAGESVAAVRRPRGRDRSRLPRHAARRGRSPRDPLHLGHHREAQGCDRHAPPGDRELAEHHRARHRAGDAREPRRPRRRRACRRRRSWSSRCSMSRGASRR